ncbi:tetratricopeptide repeat-containing sulfotransferase family protein [Vannielia sp.]|uniref:tetratricopeptide repeat-containing sulfotransferase family protein n=1 Tax=Vannielia sp. TaxID=2813045 RepID=UPI00263370E5|nr:tetratricopeptide repeat-containing sulfotransferase family protein [Vannielia sp.]MDF1871034.1 sulfotransferase [Vannielia sp.]
MTEINVKLIPAAYQRAMKLQKAGKLREAHAIYLAIVKARPQTAEAHWQMGRIAVKVGDRRAAVIALAKAQKLKPKEPTVLRDYAFALAHAEEVEAAIKSLRTLLKIVPDDFAARSELAIQLQRFGEFEKAEAEMRRCLKQQPKNGVLYRMMVTGRKIKPNDPLLAEMEALDASKKLEPRHQANLDFALGKALEDVGDFPRAWSYLRSGNHEMNKIAPYDPAFREAEVDGLLGAMEGVDWGEQPVEADDSFRPIFITGLPRSGTTLAEQIVGAHSAVTPLGEATEIGAAIADVGRRHTKEGFAPISAFTAEDLIAVRDSYQRRLRRRFSFGEVITDKSVSSWHYIGVIRRAIPNARIVVMDRDPRDNLLSMFKNVFPEGTHTYTNRIEDLVDYLKSYHRVLDFWRAEAPDAFTMMPYEELVEDPEVKARELVAAAGLEWEDGCLEYWQQKRAVRTLSLSQARQPVYKTSKRAWEKYGDDITPLIEALDKEGLLPDGA